MRANVAYRIVRIIDTGNDLPLITNWHVFIVFKVVGMYIEHIYCYNLMQGVKPGY